MNTYNTSDAGSENASDTNSVILRPSPVHPATRGHVSPAVTLFHGDIERDARMIMSYERSGIPRNRERRHFSKKIMVITLASLIVIPAATGTLLAIEAQSFANGLALGISLFASLLPVATELRLVYL